MEDAAAVLAEVQRSLDSSPDNVSIGAGSFGSEKRDALWESDRDESNRSPGSRFSSGSLEPCTASPTWHQQKLEDMSMALEAAEAREEAQAMRAKANQEKAVAAQKALDAAFEERGELEDTLAGLNARYKARFSILHSDFEAGVKQSEEKMERALKDKDALAEDISNLCKRLATAQQSEKSSCDERDVLKRNVEAMKANHASQVEELKTQLAMLTVGAFREVTPAASEASAASESLLRSELAESREKHRTAVDELAQLRSQMNSRQNLLGSQAQVADLQMLLGEACEQAVGGCGAAGGNRRKLVSPPVSGGFRRRPKPSANAGLLGIDEADDMSILSCGVSQMNLSSDAGGIGVGDLTDFFEFDGIAPTLESENEELRKNTERLKVELAERKLSFDRLQEERMVEQAASSSKAARLQDQLQTSADANRSLREERALSDVRIEELLSELRTARKQIEGLTHEQLDIGAEMRKTSGEVDDVHVQLLRAQEMQRVAEARSNELRLALETSEGQVEQLRQQLCKSGDTPTYQSGDDSEVLMTASRSLNSSAVVTVCASAPGSDLLLSLRQELCEVCEERNLLENTLELKQAQWENSMEELRLQHSAEIQELKQHAVDELETQRRESVGKHAQDDGSPSRFTDVAPEMEVPTVLPFLQKLRCPARAVSTTAKANPCQDVCWELLESIQHLICLKVSAKDLIITDASKAACSLWGAAALHGQSVLSLGVSPSRSAWLQQNLEKQVKSFCVRELGCEEFACRNGDKLDMEVLASCLPPDTRRQQAVWLIVFQPTCQYASTASSVSVCTTSQGKSASSDALPQLQSPQLPLPSREQPIQAIKYASEISSVCASDSVSNVGEHGDED